MLRSQTTQPVCSSVKNTSLRASSVGRRRASQCSPPSRVSSRAPLPPTAQPRPPPTKKTECSQANEPVRCFDQAACAEGERQKAKGKKTKARMSARAARASHFKLLPFAFCLLPFISEPAREDAREAEDGRELYDRFDSLPLVAGDEYLVAGPQEVIVARFAALDGGHVHDRRPHRSVGVPVKDDDLLLSSRQYAARLRQSLVDAQSVRHDAYAGLRHVAYDAVALRHGLLPRDRDLRVNDVLVEVLRYLVGDLLRRLARDEQSVAHEVVVNPSVGWDDDAVFCVLVESEDVDRDHIFGAEPVRGEEVVVVWNLGV